MAGAFVKPGPYEIVCVLCARLNRWATFDSNDAYVEHLRRHFIEAAPVRIIASA